MKLITNVLGVFAVRDGNIIDSILFEPDASAIAAKFEDTRDGISDQEYEIVKKLVDTKNRVIEVDKPDRFIFGVKKYASIPGDIKDVKFTKISERKSVYEIGAELGIPRDEIDRLIFSVNYQITKLRLSEIENDQNVIQAVSALDEIDNQVNVLVERLREWYSINFPEIDNIIAKHTTYVNFISSYGRREDFMDAEFDGKLGFDRQFFDRIKETASSSYGAEFSEDDANLMRIYADKIISLYFLKEKTTEYLTLKMTKIAPNLNAVAGPILGARLISIAGSLNRLSRMPASTIQILGAEDAFFKFLRTGKKPPKHGVIFQEPQISTAQKKIRGKLSRSYAAKIATCAKVDVFGGEFVGDVLREEFEKRAGTIKKAFKSQRV